MVDITKLVHGADVSHYQQRPDYGKLEADGIRFVIAKATQGNGVDPDFDYNRNAAAKAGMLFFAYPFLDPGDTNATVGHFCTVVGKDAVPALDWEKVGTSSIVMEMWVKGCEDRQGRDGLAYYGMWPPDHVTATIGKWPRWIPRYPKNLSSGPGIAAWDGKIVPTDWSTQWLVWQYTGNGRLAGISTTIDLNVLAVSFDQFKGWHDTGKWTDTTTPPNVPGSEAPPLVPTARALHLHCSGPDVRALQVRLAWLGEVVGVDGDYGPQTVKAVQDFQTKHNLAADGIAGTNVTIPAINAATV